MRVIIFGSMVLAVACLRDLTAEQFLASIRGPFADEVMWAILPALQKIAFNPGTSRMTVRLTIVVLFLLAIVGCRTPPSNTKKLGVMGARRATLVEYSP